MKLDIPYYIRQVLREQRKVHVPGIGTFRLDQTSAHFNDDKTVLSPPSLNLSFDEIESEDNSLLKYILDTGMFTESKARKKIEQYTQSAFNKLLNVDTFLIEGVGKLIKNAEEDKVRFESNISDLTKEFSDMISLNLLPIARIHDQVNSTQFVSASPVPEESGSFLPRILLFSLLFIGLFFIGKYFYNSYNNQQEKELIESPILEESNNDDIESDSREKELELRYEEIDELIDPLKDGEKVIGDASKTVKSNSLVEDAEGSQDLDDNKEELEAKVYEADTNTDKSADGSVAKNIEAGLEDKNTPKNKYEDIIPESGKCIIVVGSFIKSLNVIKMVSLLERKGYQVFQSEYKGLTRVGIKYDCRNENLESYINDIRKKVSKKAWYLDPDLDVPYAK